MENQYKQNVVAFRCARVDLSDPSEWQGYTQSVRNCSVCAKCFGVDLIHCAEGHGVCYTCLKQLSIQECPICIFRVDDIRVRSPNSPDVCGKYQAESDLVYHTDDEAEKLQKQLLELQTEIEDVEVQLEKARSTAIEIEKLAAMEEKNTLPDVMIIAYPKYDCQVADTTDLQILTKTNGSALPTISKFMRAVGFLTFTSVLCLFLYIFFVY